MTEKNISQSQMSENIIKYLMVIVILLFLGLSINTCSSNSANDLLRDKIKKSDSISKARVANYELKIDSLQSKNDSLYSANDSLESHRDTVRLYHKEKSKEAKSYSEEQADSVLDSRFANSKENLEYVVQSDSIRFEHRTLIDIYNNQVQISNGFKLQINLKEEIIKEKDTQLRLKDEVISLSKIELNEEKRKGNRKFWKGFGIGVGVTVTAVGIAALSIASK